MRRRLLAAAITVALGLAACSSSDRGGVGTLPSTTTVAATAPSTSTPPAVTCSADPGTPTTHQYREIEGVEPDLLSLDVYPLPAGCGPHPVLFWIHGGGWRNGDKSNKIAAKAALAAAEGWVLVAVNYRLSVPGKGVVWPAHGEDVAAAIGWTLDHAGSLGIDPSRVAVMGHSAGGHLASIVTVDPTLLAAAGHSREEIGCLVSLDTEGYDLVRKIDDSELGTAIVEAAFGDDFATLQAASPNFVLTQVDGRVADTIVVTRGTVKRQAIANDFAGLVGDTGAAVSIITATGYTHAGVNDAIGDPADTVVNPPVVDFLRHCLAS